MDRESERNIEEKNRKARRSKSTRLLTLEVLGERRLVVDYRLHEIRGRGKKQPVGIDDEGRTKRHSQRVLSSAAAGRGTLGGGGTCAQARRRKIEFNVV